MTPLALFMHCQCKKVSTLSLVLCEVSDMHFDHRRHADFVDWEIAENNMERVEEVNTSTSCEDGFVSLGTFDTRVLKIFSEKCDRDKKKSIKVIE